ncbi:hypothetical protein B0H03_107128 [Rathayibacter iranicus NCPPB 2253 = VKM Ac-1602]|uniref:Uncharacterized protein n=1 Tax=Rathayibacter iranicus NCPPB 2253 = VKM Ac-1602 TaxID=1328868 RepID=A0ABX5LG71_9MICO|nr:hypothetical protein B0H03_107128 [Rathayibacter iranicus NCPPB 2253 = VKM Ac-1602]
MIRTRNAVLTGALVLAASIVFPTKDERRRRPEITRISRPHIESILN